MKRLFLAATAMTVAFSLAATATAARSEINFNYGWRFGYEPPAAAGPYGELSTCAWEPIPFGSTCTGMERNPNRFNYTDCSTACCYNENCLWWQMAVGGRGHDRECLHAMKGDAVTCTVDKEKKSSFTGGHRKSVPAPRTAWPKAAAAFDDASWELVDAPHDFIAARSEISAGADSHRGYFVRGVGWYRKHFQPPTGAKGGYLGLYFEGVFHHASVFLNGQLIQTHTAGYTSFTVRLDNCTALKYGAKNVLAVRADASYGSGHWYEGGGLFRSVRLQQMASLHFVRDGVFVAPAVNLSHAGTITNAAPIAASAEVETTAEHGGGGTVVTVLFHVFAYANTSRLIGSCSANVGVGGAKGASATAKCGIKLIEPPALWGVRSPAMHRILVTLTPVGTGGHPCPAADAVNISVGFRHTEFSSATGFALNGIPIKHRGFSHHHSMGGIGSALEGIERLHLFKAQTSRAVGSNIWRMSHNPYSPPLYSILDRLGIMSWDENRDYGREYVPEMHDMVKRDRNHPSIIIWSYCNEFECEQLNDAQTTALKFRAATLGVDRTRPLTANNNGKDTQFGVDVQGFSHKNNASCKSFNKAHPKVPVVLSECCSCDSQRLPAKGNTFDSNLANDRRISSCEAAQNSPGLLPFVSGSLGVWTLFDYL